MRTAQSTMERSRPRPPAPTEVEDRAAAVGAARGNVAGAGLIWLIA